MSRITLFVIFFFLTIFQVQSQEPCLIKNITIDKSACDQSGNFFVDINFEFFNTSDKFKILGNGVNYGTFKYSDLPIKLGPLKGDCLTNYEFQIRDNIDNNCLNFKSLGKVCCTEDCKINIKNIEASNCDGSNFDVAIKVAHSGNSGNGFDLFADGEFLGFFQYGNEPLILENYEGDPFNTYITFVACANDIPTCCDTFKILNPCVCLIYDTKVHVFECSEEDSLFSLRLTFKHQMTGDSFQLGGNATNYGKYAYSDLPITINNLPFNDSEGYEFLIVDENSAFCFGAHELGKVTKCDFECSMGQPKVTVSECNENNEFYIWLNFLEKNTGLSGFSVKSGNLEFGQFQYGEGPYKIGPILGDCEKLYAFQIQDIDIEGCGFDFQLEKPICCEKECEIKELGITEICLDDILISYKINFIHNQNPDDKFIVIINGKNLGTFTYGQLPLTLDNFDFDFPQAQIKIFDQNNESCSKSLSYVFECSPESPECNFKNLKIVVTECDENGNFFAILTFDVINPGNNGFSVKTNTNLIKNFEYGKDKYEIGPLAGDCETKYSFIIKDNARPDCAEDLAFTEVKCCEEACLLMGPPDLVFECHDDKYDLTLNFIHENTTNNFIVKLNGVIRGTYDYQDLPIVIRNLNPKETYDVKIYDKEKESCFLTFELPKIECTSSTNIQELSNISFTQSGDFVIINLDNPLTQTVKLFVTDIMGRNIKNLDLNRGENQISLQEYTPGIYIFTLQTQDKSFSKKILKI